MIHAVHALMYANDAEAARAFFRDVLGWRGVDAGEGWLIFALPPGEIGIHPAEDAEDNGRCELYLMCEDVAQTVAELERKGVRILSPVADHGYGLVTSIEVPGAGPLGLYQPRHPTAFQAPAARRPKARKKAAAKKAARKKATAKKALPGRRRAPARPADRRAASRKRASRSRRQ